MKENPAYFMSLMSYVRHSKKNVKFIEVFKHIFFLSNTFYLSQNT